MDPITIGLGILALLALGKKKDATPAAAAQTAANVDAYLADLEANGATAAEKIRSELKAQALALGLVVNDVGHAMDSDGRTMTRYVTAPSGIGITASQV
jgi:hypothetical protein